MSRRYLGAVLLLCLVLAACSFSSLANSGTPAAVTPVPPTDVSPAAMKVSTLLPAALTPTPTASPTVALAASSPAHLAPATMQHYANAAFPLTFAFPAAWQPTPGYSERYAGADGFVSVSAGLTGDGWTIQTACEHEASHKMQPYGSTPIIKYLTVDGQAACAIWPSADQAKSFAQMAQLVVAAPQPMTIDGTAYRFLLLVADQQHLQAIAETVQFR